MQGASSRCPAVLPRDHGVISRAAKPLVEEDVIQTFFRSGVQAQDLDVGKPALADDELDHPRWQRAPVRWIEVAGVGAYHTVLRIRRLEQTAANSPSDAPALVDGTHQENAAKEAGRQDRGQ